MTERIKLKDYKGGLFAGKKPSAIEPSESNISKTIEGLLNARRIYNDRLNSGAVEVTKRVKDKNGKLSVFTHWIKLAKPGTPDRFAILPGGVVLFIEVKIREGRLSPEQIERHAELRKAGAVVLVARSVDEVIKFLDEPDVLK